MLVSQVVGCRGERKVDLIVGTSDFRRLVSGGEIMVGEGRRSFVLVCLNKAL